MTRYKNLSGRFMKVSENPLVIGLIGNVKAAELPKEQIEYIKSWYQVSGKNRKNG